MNAPDRRSIISAAIFTAVAIAVAMLVQLVIALVLQANISVWGLLSVTVRDTADASTIGLGMDFVQTLLLWAILTALGSIRWRGTRSRGTGAPARADAR